MSDGGSFLWGDVAVPFRAGDTVAAALVRAGMGDLGQDGAGARLRYFCGIGACQNCLIGVDGVVVEACMTPASEGMVVEPVEVTRV